MSYNNDSVRNKLIEITNQGLLLKSIALNIAVDANDLSRFKGGIDCLSQSDVEVLADYLNAVYIPQWKDISSERKKPSTKLDLLRMLMKNKSI